MVKTFAAPLDGLTGVTVMTGVILSDQLASVPEILVLELVSSTVQVPSTSLPLKRASPPGSLGLNVPVNGAVPAAIATCAASSKIVLTKFAPLPPTPENKTTRVPSGA